MYIAAHTLDLVEPVVRDRPDYYPGGGRYCHTCDAENENASCLATWLYGSGDKVNADVQLPYVLGHSDVAQN